MVGGIVVVRDRDDLAEKLEFMQNAIGSILDPFSCFLALRGVKTLPLRMQKHCANAMEIATWLNKHPKVERTLFPGLPDHPQHALAQQQMNGFGAMISLYLRTDMDGVRRGTGSLRDIYARRITGRRRKPGRSSGYDEPRNASCRTSPAAWHHRQSCQVIGRN